jgi:hypothetical protein
MKTSVLGRSPLGIWLREIIEVIIYCVKKKIWFDVLCFLKFSLCLLCGEKSKRMTSSSGCMQNHSKPPAASKTAHGT